MRNVRATDDPAGEPARGGRRWAWRLTMVVLVTGMLPVPWQHVSDSSVGLAWRMDRRLVVDDARLDPPGRYSWLTVGRPALLAELAWHRLARLWSPAPDRPPTSDLRRGQAQSRPVSVEPVAAAVGLAAAGRPVDSHLRVRVSLPLADGLPDQALVTHLNGQPIRDLREYHHQLDAAVRAGRISFTTSDGDTHHHDLPHLPYFRVELAVVVSGIDAAVGGHGPPYSWIRSMAMGASHGLMVGLTTYAAFAEEDLAAGRHVAGTGTLASDGTVGRIGGLPAKAAAARRAGVDVLLVPAEQAHQLDGFEPGAMQVLEVTSLDDAIDQLRATRP